jgi:hypothetical protein
MNIFNFDLNYAVIGLFDFFWSGVAFGMLWLGLIRFLLLSVFERRES